MRRADYEKPQAELIGVQMPVNILAESTYSDYGQQNEAGNQSDYNDNGTF